jgi:hypothetical protein
MALAFQTGEMLSGISLGSGQMTYLEYLHQCDEDWWDELDTVLCDALGAYPEDFDVNWDEWCDWGIDPATAILEELSERGYYDYDELEGMLDAYL